MAREEHESYTRDRVPKATNKPKPGAKSRQGTTRPERNTGEDALGSEAPAVGGSGVVERERAQRRTSMEQPTTGNARDEYGNPDRDAPDLKER